MARMELALRRTGDAIALIWRGGEHARGTRRGAELLGGSPIEGKVVAHDTIATQLAGLPHGSIVTAECTFQSGRGFVAERVMAVEPFEAAAEPGDVLASLIHHEDWARAAAFAAKHVSELARSHAVLSLAVVAHAGAGDLAMAKRVFGQLLDSPVSGPPLPPVHVARKALGTHVTDKLLKQVAAFYGAHIATTRVFPTNIPLRLWPTELLVSYAATLGETHDPELAHEELQRITKLVRGTRDAQAIQGLDRASADLATKARAQDAAVAHWRKHVLAKGTKRELGKTVTVAAANLDKLGVADAARKALLATAIPVRVAYHWRATVTRTKRLATKAAGYFRIGIAPGPADEQITSTVAIDARGRVYQIVDDGEPHPELIASSIVIFVARLWVMRSYLAESRRVVGKGKRSSRFEAVAREVLTKLEPKSMTDFWSPPYWVPE